MQSGIKLVNEFDVAPGQRVDLMLDFNACKSIVKRGNGTYALKPVIKVIPFVLNGIHGVVEPAASSAMVTAQQNGALFNLQPRTQQLANSLSLEFLPEITMSFSLQTAMPQQLLLQSQLRPLPAW